MTIDNFILQYEWLSNFSNHGFYVGGTFFKTNEHWYQAAKTLNKDEQKEIVCASTPGIAKKLGRKVTLREDWDAIKNMVMYIGLKNKFTQNEYLVKYLLDTEDQELIEGNYWNDTYWGVCNNVGQNWLGKLLMKLRDEFRHNTYTEEFF